MSAAVIRAEDTDMPLDEALPEEEQPDPVLPPDSISARATFALGVIYLLLLLLASRYPVPGGVWGTALVTIVFVFLPMAIIRHGVGVPLGAGGEALAGLIAVGVWLALVGMERQGDAALIVPARSVALLAACLFFGMLVSRVLRDRNILLPALIMAAAVDVISVGWGFTGHALAQTPDLIAKLSVVVPKVTAPTAAGAPPHFALLATMGVGDFFFLAFFFAAALRFGLPLRKTFWFVFPLLLIAMFLTLGRIVPGGGVPGLPFIAVGFLAANYREFHLSPREKRDLAIAGAVVAAFVAAMFLLKAYVG